LLKPKSAASRETSPPQSGSTRKIAAADPGCVEAHYGLALLHEAAGRNSAAALALRKTVALAPDDSEAHLKLGAALRKVGDRTAVDVLRRAVRLSPDDPDGYNSLAGAHGEQARAREVIGRLLALHPANVDAWVLHAGLKTFRAGDPDLERMEALLAEDRVKDGQAPSSAIALTFALGKAWMDVGDAERAFRHLSLANCLKRATFDYDVRLYVRRLAAIPDGVRRLKERLSGPGDSSELPVFVVGMPRSGTTLVEQILASHSFVQSGGELTAFEDAAAEAFRAGGLTPRHGREGGVGLAPWSRFDPSTLGRAYLSRIDRLAARRRRFVDKLPANFQNLGLISLALPNARIVHCRRDPLDTCLSSYATNFVAGQLFAYDLVELGHYYSGYAALMDHWRRFLPAARFLEIRYEDVVVDLEAEARRLVDFLGLDWERGCLRFHENRRPVRTASVNQVREPVDGKSVGRWRAYESHLRPLIEALRTTSRGSA
jgi:tetratricopeptide (TPR) repeat protein